MQEDFVFFNSFMVLTLCSYEKTFRIYKTATSVAEPPLFWAAPAPYTNSFHFELLKSQFLMQVSFGSHLPL